jgi:putative membrane-bound dehydrogenase-like protein
MMNRTAAGFVWLALACGTAVSGSEPAAGLDALALPADLEATLFAAEPLLSSPSDIDVDARGRIWVCEVLNYRGWKDTRAAGDRILVLEDTDGDGAADKQTVFHQGRDVDSALGICVIGDGPGLKVIVSCAPDVFVFHDDDGDLKADRRESLFTKIGQPQHDHSVHAFVVGSDGRWYFNFGNTGGAVHDKDGRPVKDRFGNPVNDSGKPYRQGMVFRCRPDGTDFEVLAHNFRNNYEVAVDSFGTLWQSDNDDDGNRGVRINFVMEHGNYGYVDERTGAGWQVPRANLEAEVPLQHWHQNDPGVVPNLLQTGAGSPTGICVYEGSLLPERFRGSLIHCDAGPNAVRAYHVKPEGAGFTATIEALVDGARDQWFRPSDVCVAPDGSLIVADWHDPGVGGHGMGDMEKGRLYRIAPRGVKWSVPAVDFGSAAAAVAALASPNLSTRATALERLSAHLEAARPALAAARDKATDPRLRARLAWAVAMLPEGAESVSEALAAESDDMRLVALRIRKLAQGDVIDLVERLAPAASPAVARECAIALRGLHGERIDRAWALLAAAHEAGDRWSLEALGIGADSVTGFGGASPWDGRLAAWLAHVGDGWKTPAGREIVWRSRATQTPRLLGELIVDPTVTTPEALALVRALDFQDSALMRDVVRQLVKRLEASDEKSRRLLPVLVRRLEPADTKDPVLAEQCAVAAGLVKGTQQFVDIVHHLWLTRFAPDLVALAAADGTPEQVAASAAGTALFMDTADEMRRIFAQADPAAFRLLQAVGIRGGEKATDVLRTVTMDAAAAPAVRAAAIQALARSAVGAGEILVMARDGILTGTLPQVAAVAIAASPWSDVRQQAATVLPMPRAKEGNLPPVAELLERGGRPDRGRGVFAGAGTCAKCHVVGGEGRAVGPNLSGIGAKLSRSALYEAILSPSAAISHNYETFTALLVDGRSITGLLVSQTADEVVIRGADGIDATIPAAEIEELFKQPVSLMPADLATLLSADELVDLVAWLETLKQTN